MQLCSDVKLGGCVRAQNRVTLELHLEFGPNQLDGRLVRSRSRVKYNHHLCWHPLFFPHPHTINDSVAWEPGRHLVVKKGIPFGAIQVAAKVQFRFPAGFRMPVALKAAFRFASANRQRYV